ncbi:MAG: hypothetical protein U0869_23840 [Chloroflexota bacterium]
MTALLRLYPKAWRDRYGDELEQVLAERPLGIMGTLDLIRGALDARLHPALVPATAGGPSVDLPAGRSAARRFPLGAFLATLAAGLFLVSGALVLGQQSLPGMIGTELAGVFLAISSFTLGLAVMATTGRGIIAKLAGLVFIAGIAFVTWREFWVPAVMSVAAGSAVLLVGSLVERRPPRRVGIVAVLLGAAALGAYRSESWEILGIAIAAFALVGVGLALGQGGSARPIVVGVVAVGFAVLLITAGTLATSRVRLHDGIPLFCSGMPESSCAAQLDALKERVVALRPDARVTDARVGIGDLEVCTESPVYDPALPQQGNGVHGSGWLHGTTWMACWQPDGSWAMPTP